jgi:hypothetical protein
MPLWWGETWYCKFCEGVNAVIRTQCRFCKRDRKDAEMNLIELVSKHVPEPFFNEAVKVVQAPPVEAKTNESKREWAVSALKGTLHVSENIARVLVELAVLYLQTQGGAGFAR